MECVHIIHRDKYNKKEERFYRTAFKNNLGSLSIIGTDCVRASHLEICAHIRGHYKQFPKVLSEPPIFWKFDTDKLPPGGSLRQSGHRDPCHYVVEGLEDD